MVKVFLVFCIFISLSFPVLSKEVIASWYEMGHTTANGERYNPEGPTVAHKTLPFGTKLRLTRGNRTVIVRVNDRGPYVQGRTLDMSRGTAKKLGCIQQGVCKVKMEILPE